MDRNKGKQLKALVIAEIPAPYRVDVFLEMSKWMQMDIFFNSCKDQSRSPDYFVKSDRLTFRVLDNEESNKRFESALKHLKFYDLVIAYHPTCRPALIAEGLCRLRGIPYYVNIDGAFVNPNPVRDCVKRFVYRGARACFSGGESATNYFLHYGVKKERIFEYGFTALHEQDIEPTVIGPEKKRALRKQLGLKEKKTVLSIGQFIPRKGFDLLLNAWTEIDSADAQLLIIGGGPEKEAYEQYILGNGLNNVYLIDFLPKEELKRYYLAADVFVLPTREDVWGLVINEAMANGLPVITTDMCNAGTQLIQNGFNGYIVPVDDAHALAVRIRELLKMGSLSTIAERNLQLIRDYTIANAAISHMKAIHETMILNET